MAICALSRVPMVTEVGRHAIEQLLVQPGWASSDRAATRMVTATTPVHTTPSRLGEIINDS